METGSDNRATSRALNSEINVTPLVDVMLVVLIIFMVVTPMLQGSVQVDLPGARNQQAVAGNSASVLSVVVRESGALFVGKAPVGDEELPGALQTLHRADPELRLQVKADRAALYGRVQRVLDAGRAAGFGGAMLVVREWTPDDESSSPQTGNP
ncbi:MAG: biopolymer transporter ExbD [Candidatus Eisenbacteria bacterium]|nr:biopolymer transporter ExbD [Candidatus Eisenbacteria bacterium]